MEKVNGIAFIRPVHLPKFLFIQIRPGNPVKAVPLQSHAPCQFQHILTVDFSHIRYPSVTCCHTRKGMGQCFLIFCYGKL
jgi:hypothetical protein